MRLSVYCSNAGEHQSSHVVIRIQVMENKRLIVNIRPDHHHEIILQKPYQGHAS
nr:hypothetical protein [uncultured Prevotella sp.]